MLSFSKPAKRAYFPLAIALTLLPVAAGGDPPLEEEPVLIFAAGRTQGNYYAVSSALAEEMGKRGRRVELRETQGSYDNAELLRDGGADLALLQSDVAYLEHYNGRPFLALASIYTEPIHIIAYRGLDLRRISDLIPGEERFAAAVGAPGSGSSAHALAILDELGLPPERLTTVPESIDAASASLRNRVVDLAFVTSAVPAGTVQELATDRIISLLDIDHDIAQRLRRRNPFFVAAEIPYDAYEVGRRSVQTLGTRTLMVGRPGLRSDEVRLILDSLYAVAARADEAGLPFLSDLTPANALDHLAIPAHPASKEYHAERIGLYREVIDYLHRNLILLILVASVVLALVQLSRFAYFVHQFVLGRVLLSLLAVWLVGSAAMHFLEGTKNSAFRTFGSSAIAILHYLFSGLEAKYPVTTAGNVVAILVLSLGVGIVTLFTATLVTLLIEQALNIKTLRLKPVPFLRLSGHTVIAGWSGRSRRVIRQLRSPDLLRKPTVVVIASQASETKVDDRRCYRGVWVVEGDRSRRETLERADIASASRAIVLATDSSDRHADHSSISCALAIERLAPAVHTIVEARASTAVEHLTQIRADEIVNTEILTQRLLSQCVITPGISQVFNELLSFGKRSQEVYILPIRGKPEAMSFAEVREHLRPCDAILLGYWRRGEARAQLNPDLPGRELPLRAGGKHPDKVVVLADSPKALSSLGWRLEQRRQAMSETTRDDSDGPLGSTGRDGESTPAPDVVGRASRVGICGWSDEARAVVSQLQSSVKATHQDFQITIIDGPVKQADQRECSRNVRFVFGDPTRSAVLENAGVGEMETLVILADRTDEASERFSDHRTLMVCLAARQVSPEVHLIAEVLNSGNQEHFERIPGTEIVSVEDLAEKLLAQAVISPGITGIFLELLTATEDSNEIYVVPVPPRWQGAAFSQVALEIEQSDPPIIALGYRTTPADGAPVTVLNPGHRRTELHGVVDWRQRSLGDGDSLVVMAYQEPAW